MNDTRNEQDDIVYEEDENRDSFGRSGKEKKLREKLKVCETEKQEYLEGWQRAKADLVNARREFEETLAKYASFANENFIHELIPVLDSFEMAFSNKEKWEEVGAEWRTGVEYIYTQFVSVLQKNGLSEISPEKDTLFDPAIHESIGTENTEKSDEDGIIAAVVQKGYVLNGKLLRAAKVRVYKHESS